MKKMKIIVLLKLRQSIMVAVCLSFVLTFRAYSQTSDEAKDKPLQFQYESYGIPQFDTLLTRWNYDELASQGKTEFEKMRIVMDWVYRKIYFFDSSGPNLRNAIEILQRAGEGKPFYCVNLAAVFLQCAESLGWTPRYIEVYSPLEPVTHTVNDIWSDQFRKWVFMDPTFNIYFECQGVPQSTFELRQAWLKNKGADMEVVFSVGDRERRWMLRDLPLATNPGFVPDYQTWISGKQEFNNAWRWWPLAGNYLNYFVYVSYWGRNNLFATESNNKIYIMRDDANENDPKWAYRNGTDVDNPGMLYHDLNRTDIIVNPLEGKYAMNIGLEAFGSFNYTPNFREFLVSIDHGEWEVKPASFMWKHGKGHHELQAKIVNKFGLEGPVTILFVDQPDVKSKPQINTAYDKRNEN